MDGHQENARSAPSWFGPRRSSADTASTISLDNSTGPSGTTGWTRYAFERDVSPDGVDIWFGVFLSGNGTAWFDGLEIDIEGVPFQEGPEPYIGEPAQELLDWVRNTAMPVNGADPVHDYDDLAHTASRTRRIGKSEISGKAGGLIS